ncbi:hypothetical protein MNB_SV-12-1392 [hydrothermal vent metagenome]|uniref:Uncharacterized protein n=1 Tax=hydrothermal vent metagenome TaxID=652676 RepID=A0A1W1BZN4_9ZZZZ
MRDDPFYLSKVLTLEASLGVLSADGNFECSIAYFDFFVKLRWYNNIDTSKEKAILQINDTLLLNNRRTIIERENQKGNQ